jgi:hypothetical protein
MIDAGPCFHRRIGYHATERFYDAIIKVLDVVKVGRRDDCSIMASGHDRIFPIASTSRSERAQNPKKPSVAVGASRLNGGPRSMRSGTQGFALRRPFGFIRAANWRFQKRNFSNRINLIWPVQSCLQKYFRSRLTQITSISPAVPPHRGAYRDRHERGAGCGGRERRC